MKQTKAKRKGKETTIETQRDNRNTESKGNPKRKQQEAKGRRIETQSKEWKANGKTNRAIEKQRETIETQRPNDRTPKRTQQKT